MRGLERPIQRAHANYPESTKSAIVTPEVGENITFLGATLNNNSGGDQVMGIGFRFINSRWLFGQWDDSETASLTDDTADAQDTDAGDVPLFTTTSNDGFVVQARDRFGIIGLDISTSEAGSPTYSYQYWNGSAWTNLNTIAEPATFTSGENNIVFAQPLDWTALADGDTPVDTDGLTAGFYAIRVRATTAPSTAPVASEIWVAQLYDYKEAVSDNDVLNITVEDPIGFPIDANSSIIPYFSSPNNDNTVTVRYRVRD